MEVLTPGGGGYGPAFERDARAVRRDVLRGYYGAPAAERLFGVRLVGEDLEIDLEATERLRAGVGLGAVAS